jgi:carbon monoxide dehydrogenase subunit G
MKIAGTVSIAAPRQQVWDALNDPDVLSKAIPGCEKFEKIGDDEYAITQSVGIASIRGHYTGKMALRDKSPPESCNLKIEGKGPGGFVNGTAKVTLAEKAAGTELSYDSDMQVGGLLASLGSRLIEPVAKQLVGQFFKSLEQQIR